MVSFIKEQLVSGALKEGDMLLPERELAAALSVSRPMVREALRALAIIGAVEIVHGVGTVVRRPDASALGEFFGIGLVHHPHIVEDVIETRVALECQSIRLACKRATAADFLLLEAGVDKIRSTIGDWEAGAKADFDFHRTLVLASKSQTLVSIYAVISDLLLRSHANRRREVAQVPALAEDIVRAHVNIVEVIRSGNADLADRTLRAHFDIGSSTRL